MTDDEYQNFRLMALAKANGRTVHKINNLLGVVLNANRNAVYWNGKNNTEAQSNLKMRNDAMAQISTL